MEILRQPEEHDVIVIGSGASGGMAAYNLTSKGVKVLMLDAGDVFDVEKFWNLDACLALPKGRTFA